MTKALFSIKGHNAYGNIGAGASLLALGIALSFGGGGLAAILCAVCLLVVAGVSLYACLSRKHEPHDEMSEIHDGQASSFALKTTLIVLGIACCVGLFTGLAFSLAAVCCLAIGLAMVLYGCSFAWYERGEHAIQNQDARVPQASRDQSAGACRPRGLPPRDDWQA